MNNPALGLRKKHSSAGRQAGVEPQVATQTGPIAGPGTGTSDSIPTAVDEGTYIMPQDSTQALGLGMKPKVPANVSNGEYQIAPEDVYELGRQVLDKVRETTHAQVPEQDGPVGSFANGGAVFSGTDPDELGRNNTPKRPVINAPDPMYVDSKGNATKAMPSQSRALVPVNQPNTLPVKAPSAAPQAPAAGMRPNAGATFYGNSQGDMGRGAMPSSSRAVVPGNTVTPSPTPSAAASPPPNAGMREPDYRARAETMARAKADTAAYEAHRANQDRAFSNAAANGANQSAPAQSKGLRNLVNGAGKVGGTLAAVPAITGALEEDSTARYAKRFGIDEPTGDGSLGDTVRFIGLRALGAASDIGSGLTFGLADRFYRDKQEVDTDALALGGGMAAGGLLGHKTGPAAGRAIDKVVSLVTRGRYHGDAAERLLKRTGATAGAVAGGTGASMLPGEINAASAENPSPDVVTPQVSGGQVDSGSDWTNVGYGGIAMRNGENGTPEFTNDASALAGAKAMPEGGIGGIGDGRGSFNTTPAMQNVATGTGGRAGGGIAFSGTTGGDENAMDRAARRREFAIAGGLRNPSQRSLRDLEQASINRQELGLKRQESAQNAERQAQTDASRMALEQAQTEQAQTNSALARTDLSGKQRLDSLIQTMNDAGASEEDRALARSTYIALTTQAKDRYVLQDEQMGKDANGAPRFGKVAYDVTTGQRLGGQSSGQQSSFEKGKVYKNANGERARYSGTDASGNPIWEQV